MAEVYTVIVNSSDGYRDCWDPFFTLFARYWPDCNAPVLLNTELARYEGSAIAVQSSCVQQGMDHRPTWGECLTRCLAMVDTPLVIYLQEDYFLEGPVNTERVDGFARRMLGDAGIGQIGLTAFGSYGPFRTTDDFALWEVDRRARYRTSLQAALWRTDVLQSYVRPEENGWMFEIFGTRRSWRRNDLFLTVNRDRERDELVFPYTNAGIVKGQWDRRVPGLFKREGIEMDFARRGFFRPRPRALEKLRTLRKLLEHPAQLVRGLAGR